jgi:hypothetical protein
MLGNSSKADKHFQDNLLKFHLRTFAASLMDGGYADVTVKSIPDAFNNSVKASRRVAQHIEIHMLAGPYCFQLRFFVVGHHIPGSAIDLPPRLGKTQLMREWVSPDPGAPTATVVDR